MPGPPNTNAYSIKFNAPALISADISRYPGLDAANMSQRLEGPRGEIVGQNLVDVPRNDVILRKGFFIPDTSFASDWQDTTDDEDLQDDGAGTQEYSSPLSSIGNPLDWAKEQWEDVYRALTDEKSSSVPDKLTINNMFPNNQKFGFRFMYNPPQLQFQVGIPKNVNASYILQNPDTGLPITSTGSTVQLDLEIFRVDDMSIISWAIEQAKNDSQLLNRLYGTGAATLPSHLPDPSRVSNGVTIEDLEAIRDKGTMYDLDFMFKTTLGRQWNTVYRGTTADIGIAFSQPLMLYLSKTMVYRAMLTSINYTHLHFTPDMVPTRTMLSLGFQRIPDGKSSDVPLAERVVRNDQGQTYEEFQASAFSVVSAGDGANLGLGYTGPVF